MNAPVVLITGALTGIGRATALAFAAEGAQLVVSGRRDDLGHALSAELRGLGARAEYLRADVRNESDVRALIEQTVERFGRIDVAINNAGTEGQPGRRAARALPRRSRRPSFSSPATRRASSPGRSSMQTAVTPRSRRQRPVQPGGLRSGALGGEAPRS